MLKLDFIADSIRCLYHTQKLKTNVQTEATLKLKICGEIVLTMLYREQEDKVRLLFGK